MPDFIYPVSIMDCFYSYIYKTKHRNAFKPVHVFQAINQLKEEFPTVLSINRKGHDMYLMTKGCGDTFRWQLKKHLTEIHSTYLSVIPTEDFRHPELDDYVITLNKIGWTSFRELIIAKKDLPYELKNVRNVPHKAVLIIDSILEPYYT